MELMDMDEAVAVFDDYTDRLKMARELASKSLGPTFELSKIDDNVKSSLESFEQLYKRATAESIIIMERMIEQRSMLPMNLPAVSKFLRAQNNFKKENHASIELLQKLRPDESSVHAPADPPQPEPENALARKIKELRAKNPQWFIVRD